MTVHSQPLAKAWNLYEADRYELALQAAADALGSEPDAFEPRQLMSLCLSQLKRFDEAIRVAQEALLAGPDEAFSHHVLGHAWYRMARATDHGLPSVLKEAGVRGEPIDRAIAAYREAIRIEPTNAYYHEMLGFVLFQGDHEAQAEESVREALRLDPQRAESFSLLANICRSTRRYKQAHHYALQSLAVDADLSGSHASLGWAKLMHGDAKESLDLFREAMRLDPNDRYARQGLVEGLKVQHAVVRLPYRVLHWVTDLSLSDAWGRICVGIVIGFALLLAVVGWLINRDADQALTGGVMGLVIGVFLFFALRMLPVYSMALLTMCNVVLLWFPMGRHALTPWQRYRAAALCGYVLPIVAMIVLLIVSGLSGGSPTIEFIAEWVVGLTLLAGPLSAWAAALTTRWVVPAGIIAAGSVLVYLLVLLGVPGLAPLREEPVPQVLLLVGVVWGLVVPSRL